MSLEYYILIFLLSFLVILLIFQSFFSNSNNSTRIKILVEKQETLEKSILNLMENNFNKIDSKFDKSSNETTTNLYHIKE